MSKFDVFLSYKQSDCNGKTTPEVEIANELYAKLKNKGVNAFYSKQTIGIIGEAKYKSAIDDALDEADILVAIASSEENINSNWVKYEWDSFYSDILSGRKNNGQVISLTENMLTQDLPRTLRQLQSFGNGKDDIDNVLDFVLTILEKRKNTKSVRERLFRIASMGELLSNGLTASEIAEAVTENDAMLYNSVPRECIGTSEQWASVYSSFPNFSDYIIDEENKIYGNYFFVALTTEQERLLDCGKLIDTNLTVNSLNHISLPEKPVAYLLNMNVNPMAESTELYHSLWNAFIDKLKKCAKDDKIFFDKIYYKAFLPEHELKMAARGFRYCCDDELYGKIYVQDMDPKGSLRILDSELADIYGSSAIVNKRSESVNLEALTAHMGFWRQIEELFYHPKYCRLKKYFMGNAGIPQNSAELKLGLAVAMWLRDIIQYSSVLLPFLPKEQQDAHNLFEKKLLDSELIQKSINQYKFSTEDERLSVDLSNRDISVKSIVTFAHIWLDLGRLFMATDIIDFRPYFYDHRNEIPPKEQLDLCEGLAIRVLTAMHISEDQLLYLPEELVESYYDYKDAMLNSAIIKHVLKKYNFIERELLSCN